MKRLRRQILLLIAVIPPLVFGGQSPQSFRLDAAATPGGRLPSNSIIDIIPSGDSLWFGTGQGIAELHLNDGGWTVIGEGDGLGQGGLSALVVNDTVIWAATAYSENISGSFYPAGGGVGYSRDFGKTWYWVPQPVDSRTETRYSPTTTNVQNVTYDIAVSDSAVWITSWGGGLRRKLHRSTEWEVITPDGQPFSALNNLNHRAFSVVFKNHSLFVGTAAGIARSDNEGKTWIKYSHLDDDPNSISGNFVTAMAAQSFLDGSYYLWAAGWQAQSVSEYYGACVFDGNGWTVSLSDSTVLPNGDYLVDDYGPLRVHNFGFQGAKVFAAADGALWWHPDRGIITGPNAQTWKVITGDDIYDPTVNERLTGTNFYSVCSTGDSIWVGTDQGLAVGWNDPNSGDFVWRVIRSFRTPAAGGEPSTYAYPSPFSPVRGSVTRFQFPVPTATSASVAIFNFAMETVLDLGGIRMTGGGTGTMAGYGAFMWDGKDRFGNFVANGVYFYRIKTGGSTYWGKVMVLN